MSPGDHDELLGEASVLKMRAIRLRALGDDADRWQAIVLLHEAARMELDAVTSLPRPSAQEQTGARAEACGLFLEARDPPRAAKAWADLPRWAFASEAGAAMLADVRERLAAARTGFTKAWRSLGGAPGMAPRVSSVEAARLRELLEVYPGVAELWWALSLRAGDQAEAQAARARARELEPSLAQDAHGQAAWEQLEEVLAPRLKIEMRAERRDAVLLLDQVGRIAAAFGELLSSFVERMFGEPIDVLPSSASAGSFTFDVVAQSLPPGALAELDQALSGEPHHVDTRMLVELLELLQQNGIRLAVSGASGVSQIIIDARRRKRLLSAAEAVALRTLDSRDVPQADDLARVFDIVQKSVNHEDVDAETLGITPRQVAYYRRAAKILGLLSESAEPTAAGRLIGRLGPEDRLRAAVVYFESSLCGDAWIRWSKGKTLLDVKPETAGDFLRASVPGLADETAGRRAQTLMAWHHALVEYHYAG
jgi:hypothetical protein